MFLVASPHWAAVIRALGVGQGRAAIPELATHVFAIHDGSPTLMA